MGCPAKPPLHERTRKVAAGNACAYLQAGPPDRSGLRGDPSAPGRDRLQPHPGRLECVFTGGAAEAGKARGALLPQLGN